MKKEISILQKKEGRIGLLLCIPAILVISFAIYSLVYALLISFNDNKAFMMGSYKFVGLKNYLNVLTNKTVRDTVWNTLYYSFFTVVVELILGLIVSNAMRRELPGTNIAKVGIVLPMMMAPVASGAIWQWMFTERYGVINNLLAKIGITGPNWLGMPIPAKWAVIIVSVWGAAPFVILVLISAIGSIPKDVIEAAKIDGANDRQLYWNIIFPYLKPAISLILMIRIPDALRMYDLVYILTQGGPSNSTQVVSYYIYTRGFRTMKFGDASAAAFLLFIAIAILTLVANKLLKRKS